MTTARRNGTGQGLKPVIDPEIASAKEALSGLSHDTLLHMAAHDWVKGRHLLALLEDRTLGAEAARRVAIEATVQRITERDAIAQKARSETASKAGKASKRRFGPLKATIKEEYDRWQARQSTFNSASHFAVRMRVRYGEEGATESTIKRWCTTWKKEKTMSSAS